MKKISILLALFAAAWSAACAAPISTNSAVANRILMIDSSSMPIGGGSATLTIGALHRVDGVYIGDYKLKVFPYFLKNDKGRLAILVSDASLAKVNRGKVAAITGTATTSSKGGQPRPIAAIATPADINHGQLKLWFMAGSRQMVFEPAYHFTEVGTTHPETSPFASLGPPESGIVGGNDPGFLRDPVLRPAPSLATLDCPPDFEGHASLWQAVVTVANQLGYP